MLHCAYVSDERIEKIPAPDMLAPEGAGRIEHGEVGHETKGETKDIPAPQEQPVAPPIPRVPVVTESPKVRQVNDEVLKKVEDILSAGLKDIYVGLPEAKKKIFRAKGEEAATSIRLMLSKGKLKVHAVLHVIREWLRTIPGVNKFFLEQEAKIKTDQILAYGESQLGKDHNAL